jgi:thioredoxin 1
LCQKAIYGWRIKLNALCWGAEINITGGNTMVMHITDQSFDEEIINSKTPALVDFWAEWCGPCRMVGPVIDELANEYAGKVKIAKINVDDNREVPARFGIRNIPTMILFKDGQPVQTIVGARPKEDLAKELDKLL